MSIPVINPHLNTTNVYIKRNIIADNVDRMTKYVYTSAYRNLSWYQRKDYCIDLTNQRRLLIEIDKKIKELEQLSFPFGSTLS